MVKKTPLYDCHVEGNGKMVDFAGYLLPVQYSGIISEHNHVREKAGIFDVSHMGEIVIQGKDAFQNIQKLLTNDFTTLKDGMIRYTVMCNDEGGVMDDFLVYRYDLEKYLLVVNAANRVKDLEWIQKHVFGEVTVKDLSDETSLIALQGPMSDAILAKLMMKEEIPEKYYSFKDDVDISGEKCMISQTGYTGEKGYEIYCANDSAPRLWQALLTAGEEFGLIACGLGARDTLRLEAGMPLYGHELSETISPLEADLPFVVKMNKEDFIGKNALVAKGQPAKVRVGFKITGRGIVREDADIFIEDTQIGETTSGSHAPYLGYPIAMGMVEREYSAIGTVVDIEVRGRKISAEIVSVPFYQRTNQ